MYSEGNLTAFPESSPPPTSPIFRAKPLYSSVELHHPTPINRVAPLSLFSERVVDQMGPIRAGFNNPVPLTQEANANDCETLPQRKDGFPDVWIVRNKSDLEDLSILGGPATPQVPSNSARGMLFGHEFPPAGSGRPTFSLNTHDPYLRTRNLPHTQDATFRHHVWEERLIQSVPPSPDPRHKSSAVSAPLNPGRTYQSSELRQHFPTGSWDLGSDVLARTDRSLISPLLGNGMTTSRRDFQVTKSVQPLSPAFSNDARQTSVRPPHLSTWARPFSPLSSPAPPGEYIQARSRLIADNFNRKLMKHVSENYPAPLPALNFVDALLRRRRDNKYLIKGYRKFHPQSHKPELTGDSGHGSGFSRDTVPGRDNLVASNGGRSAESGATNLYAQGAFAPSWSNYDSTELREMSDDREAANIIHKDKLLGKLLDAETGRGSRPSSTNAAYPALHALRDRPTKQVSADPRSTRDRPSPQNIRTPGREAAEMRSWPSQNDNPSGHAPFGNLKLGPRVQNVASYPRTLPSEPLPPGNLNVNSYVKGMASSSILPRQLQEQVDRNSGGTESALPPTPGRTLCTHTSSEIHPPTVTGHAIPDTSRCLIGDERIHRLPQPGNSERCDVFMRGPEDVAFSEVMDEDNQECSALARNGGDISIGGEGTHTYSIGSRWRNGGGGSSTAQSVVAENDDVLEWSENGGTRRGSPHDSIESWSNKDVLSFLRGEPRRK